MALTGKQKRVLRSLGMTTEATVHVGKGGAEAALGQVEDVFRTRELVKVKLVGGTREDTLAAAAWLAVATRSEVAGRVGFTFLLYRANPGLKERIVLPVTRG